MLQYLKTVGVNSNVASGRGFNYPYGTAISSDQRLFVLTRANPLFGKGIRIQICTIDDQWIGEFSSGPGTGDDQFVVPVSMSFDNKDHLYVTDESLNEVKIFDRDGVFLQKWGNPLPNGHILNGPAGIAHASDGSVYLVEQGMNRINKLSESGELLASWGKGGSANGEFNLPWGITLDAENRVYVADWRNDRIQQFTEDGEFIQSFCETGDLDGQLYRPSDVAVDGNGMIAIADWGNERVQVLHPDGSLSQVLYGESTLSKWAIEWLDSNVDQREARLNSTQVATKLPKQFQNNYHRASQSESLFWGPVAVVFDSNNRLYVTEHSRHRLQIFE